jgi:hypothetical protein
MATAPTTVTIKKADNTTDVVYTLMTASGGDKSPTVYRSLSTAGNAGQHPEFRMWAANNGSNTARKVVIEYTFPSVFTETTTGLVKTQSRANLTLQGSVPQDMANADVLEMGAQLGNLLNQSVTRTFFQTQYAPT